MDRKPLASVPELAAYLGIPEKSIRGQVLRKVGVGRYAFRVGRHLRWEWSDVDKFVESQKKAKQAA